MSKVFTLVLTLHNPSIKTERHKHIRQRKDQSIPCVVSLHSYKHNDITTLLCRYLCLCRYVANVDKALQCARLSPCRNVRMTTNFLADWTCNNLSDENPLGTRVQLLVTEGCGSHSSTFGRHPRAPTFFFLVFSSSVTPPNWGPPPPCKQVFSYTFFGGNVVRVLVHLFFFTAAYFHIALMAASISHVVTAVRKFSCCSSNKK